MDKTLEYVQANHDRFLDELKELLRIPSISSSPDHKEDMVRCAELLSWHLENAGFDDVKTFPTAGHPVVYAEWTRLDGAPTVLIYGHYDVQPAEPLDKWVSDPFKPEVRGDNLYARGATDMKGQVAAAIDAVESILKTGSIFTDTGNMKQVSPIPSKNAYNHLLKELTS